MGQKMSRRHYDDNLTLFPPLNDSTNSLINDSILDDYEDIKHQKKKRFRTCQKIYKFKRYLSECFRFKFDRLNEADDYNGEIMNANRSKPEVLENQPHTSKSKNGSEHSKNSSRLLSSEIWTSQDLPRDIHEVHNQLTSLMSLLSQTDNTSRDVSCQTLEHDIGLEDMIKEKETSIFEQQEKFNCLQLELKSKSVAMQKYIREIAVLKSQLVHQRIDSKSHLDMVTFLKSFKQGKIIQSNDIAKVNDIIELLTYPHQHMKTQIDKSNVAVINPCSNFRKEPNTFSFSSMEPTTLSEDQTSAYNSTISHSKDLQETKLICFLDHSVTPYISTIPLSPSRITLFHVKLYTKSVIPNNSTCHYIFKTRPGSQQIQEEITQDSDYVPVQDNKIIVRVRM